MDLSISIKGKTLENFSGQKKVFINELSNERYTANYKSQVNYQLINQLHNPQDSFCGLDSAQYLGYILIPTDDGYDKLDSVFLMKMAEEHEYDITGFLAVDYTFTGDTLHRTINVKGVCAHTPVEGDLVFAFTFVRKNNIKINDGQIARIADLKAKEIKITSSCESQSGKVPVPAIISRGLINNLATKLNSEREQYLYYSAGDNSESVRMINAISKTLEDLLETLGNNKRV